MSEQRTASPKLLGMSGSLREKSFSAAILRTVKDKVSDRADLEIFPLHDLPLYNEDLDQDGKRPESVEKFKAAVGNAAGLFIITPEYNYSMSGVLKNAIDWASRPAYNSVLKDKPVLVAGSSMAFTGAVRALAHLKLTLLGTLSRVVNTPDILIATAHDKVKDGQLTDEVSIGFLERGVDSLLEEIRICSTK